MNERKVIAGVLAAVGLIVSGAGLLAQQDKNEGVRKPVQLVKKDLDSAGRGLKALASARVETAREILADDMERLQHMGAAAATVPAEIPFWSHRLMGDRLRLASTQAERIAAIREHRDRMKDLERLLGRYAQAGQGRISDALKATYYRLEADQLLVEAGADAGDVLLPALLKTGHKPQPQPPAAPAPPPAPLR